MSESRLHDDKCQMWTELRQSVGPGTYVLSRPLRGLNSFVPDPQVSSQGVQVSVCADRPLVDVDSELLGITRRAAKCPQAHHVAGTGNCSLQHAEQDSTTSMLEPEATRTSNPSCTLRGTGWNRWEWLCEDPQVRAEVPFETNVNYRSVVKDNHRPLIPKLLADPALPPPAPLSPMINNTPNLTAADLPPMPQRPHWRTCTEVARINGVR